jgi:plastocyanin
MKATLSALVLTLALVAAGCGSSSSSSGSSGSGSSSSSGGGYGGTPAKKTASKPASASSGNTVAVSLQNIAFNPSTIHAKVGQTITWTNRDGVPHNVTATKGGSFKSPTLNQGQSYSYKLAKAGTITYVCTFHQGMTATLVVAK